VIDLCRRGAKGIEHFSADSPIPSEWDRVAELFAREMKGFAGERVVFVHSAGTLDPIGFAGEVDAAAYTRAGAAERGGAAGARRRVPARSGRHRCAVHAALHHVGRGD
jgi:hypothetical protein